MRSTELKIKKPYENYDDEVLFRYYRDTKDVRIRNYLVEKYLFIPKIIAKKFANRGVEYDDIYQVASLALIRAVDRYDVDRGYKFSSYATPTIVGEIKNYFRDKSKIIRLPRSNSELLKKIGHAKSQLTQQLGRIPTAKEIGDKVGLDEEKVIELIESGLSVQADSLDRMIGEQGDKQLSEIIGKEESCFTRIENRDFMEKCIDNLNLLEKRVIRERFFEEKTQREVAEGIGVSQMYISRLERKLLEKFRRVLKNM
ncbi:MAG TPA: sigma-70 family RNA polymerase sigma factor [Clostridiales bacterium]|nr:sigma-70 family RNA polymerase sigma factor [Clostridiales bacterium]